MKDWLKYMKQEEIVNLQFDLGRTLWVPPTRDQVERMLQEIRGAQTERSKLTK